MNYKPTILTSVESLTVQHQAVLSGIKKGKSYKQIAEMVGKAKSMIFLYVNELEKFGAVKRLGLKTGMKRAVILTEKGEEICSKLNL